jgi:methylated-DNA-[protein]-cysteine S-methyltransferase
MTCTTQRHTRAGAVTHCVIASPLGDLTLVARDGTLTGLYFPGHWYMPDRSTFGDEGQEGFTEVRAQLAEYFSGERAHFDVPAIADGNEFQRRVWDLVRQVPYGETSTYGHLARQLADGTTPQEIGAVIGRNPLCILIACHRIVSSTGTLTGYAGGLRRKQFLLDLEREAVDRPMRLF